jgi:hypothetical protein
MNEKSDCHSFSENVIGVGMRKVIDGLVWLKDSMFSSYYSV